MHLDYKIDSVEERKKIVDNYLIENPEPTNKQKEILSDYLALCLTKQEKKDKTVLTDNRMVTVNKREMSYEGLGEKLENGEDGISHLITDDKNIIFAPSLCITEEDIMNVPGLRELREAIQNIEKQSVGVSGTRAYLLKKSIIEARKDQYELKFSYRRPIYFMKTTKNGITKLNLKENVKLNKKGEVESDGIINLYEPAHITNLLSNYSRIKQDSYVDFNSDIRWLMMDLDAIIELALKDYPLYMDIVMMKIDGVLNVDIQTELRKKYGKKHSIEYISSLYRNKIPKIIAECAKEQWLLWYYTEVEKGYWKKCSRCGEVKLAHNKFYSKNKSSRDGWYSICKDCRNKKKDKNV